MYITWKSYKEIIYLRRKHLDQPIYVISMHIQNSSPAHVKIREIYKCNKKTVILLYNMNFNICEGNNDLIQTIMLLLDITLHCFSGLNSNFYYDIAYKIYVKSREC